MPRKISYSLGNLVMILKGMDENELKLPVQEKKFYAALLAQRKIPIQSGRVCESDAVEFMVWYEQNRSKLNGKSKDVEDVLSAAESETVSNSNEVVVASPKKEGYKHADIVAKMRSWDQEHEFKVRDSQRFYEKRISMFRAKEDVKSDSRIYPAEFVEKLMLWYGERRTTWEEGKRYRTLAPQRPRVHLSFEPDIKERNKPRTYTADQIYQLMAREDRAYGVDAKLITPERYVSLLENGIKEVGKLTFSAAGEILATPIALDALMSWYKDYLRRENKKWSSTYVHSRALAAVSLQSGSVEESSLEGIVNGENNEGIEEEISNLKITHETLCASPYGIFHEIQKLPPKIAPAKEGVELVKKYLHNSGRTERAYHLSSLFKKQSIDEYVAVMVRGSKEMPLADFIWLWYHRIIDTFNISAGGAYSHVQRQLERHYLPVTSGKIRDVLLQSRPIIFAEVKVGQKGGGQKGRHCFPEEAEKRYFSGNVKLHLNLECRTSTVRFSKSALDDRLDHYLQPIFNKQGTRKGARELFLSHCSMFTSQEIPSEVIEKALTIAAANPDKEPEKQRGFILDVLELTAGIAVLRYGLCDNPANRPDGERLRKLFRFYDGGELDTSKFKQQPLELEQVDGPDLAERAATARVDTSDEEF